MSYKIEGNWKNGLAFDHHTLSSAYLGVDQFGHDQWDNKRSEMGELVYQLKKNVEDPEERQKLLRDSMRLSGNHNVSEKKILLIDDLYRSGATLSVATELLIDQGGAASVCVLAMTKTRSRR